VIEALGSHEDDRIVPALGALTQDVDATVVEAAEAALKTFDASPDW
jgi:hypothetical protein